MRRLVVTGLFAFVLCLGVAPAEADCLDGVGECIWVDGVNCSPPGTGSETDPFCSLAQGYLEAFSTGMPTTVQVLPGIYRECPAPPVPLIGLPQPIRLIADAYQTAGDNGATVIDGSDCPPATPTVWITGEGSSLEGFTVINGSDSGVIGFGGVKIVGNVITGNEVATCGGGIFVNTGNCSGENTETEIVDNCVGCPVSCTAGMGGLCDSASVIEGNVAGQDGGGVFVFAGPNQPCAAGEAEVEVSGNTIEHNRVESGNGGGLAIFTSTFSLGELARVTASENTIRDNRAEEIPGGFPFGFGGGIWAATGRNDGLGTETVEMRNNILDSNFAERFGGGVCTEVILFDVGHRVVEMSDNTVTDNTATGGGGVDWFVLAESMTPGFASLSMELDGNEIRGNAGMGTAGGPIDGGGLRVEYVRNRSSVPEAELSITGNRITENVAVTTGGGVAFLVDADGRFPVASSVSAPSAVVTSALPGDLVAASPLVGRSQGEGPGGIPTDADILFANNLVAGNELIEESFGGGMLISLRSLGASAETSTTFLNNTVVDNASGDGPGAAGVEIESLSEESGQARVTIDSSIIAANVTTSGSSFGVGGPVSAGLDVEVLYSDVFANASGEYEVTLFPVDPTGTDGNISVDPLLAPDRRLGPGSPAVDAGNPTPSTRLPGEDFEGDPRIVEGDGVAPAVVDMGFDECTGSTEYVSTLDNGVMGGTYVRNENIYGVGGCVSSAPHEFATFLQDEEVGLDGFALREDGSVLFTVESNSFVGPLYLMQNQAYLYGSDGEISPFAEEEYPLQDLDAIDLLAGGAIAFSTKTSGLADSHFLDQESVYRFDEAAATVTLLLDGKALGLRDLDAVDVLSENPLRVAFSTSTNFYAGAVYYRQENAYLFDAGSGSVSLLFDGQATGLDSLDAYTRELSPGPVEDVTGTYSALRTVLSNGCGELQGPSPTEELTIVQTADDVTLAYAVDGECLPGTGSAADGQVIASGEANGGFTESYTFDLDFVATENGLAFDGALTVEVEELACTVVYSVSGVEVDPGGAPTCPVAGESGGRRRGDRLERSFHTDSDPEPDANELRGGVALTPAGG